MTRIALSLLVALTLAGCTSGGSGASHAAAGQDGARAVASSIASPASGAKCRADYTSRRLPPWARVGWHPPKLPVPYVLGDRGDIAAIVWEPHDPLVVPPAATKNNKILWVSRVSSGAGAPLRIRAALRGTGRTVTRKVDGGPGSSVINLPAPGCWSFDLSWGRHHDHLRLAYASG